MKFTRIFGIVLGLHVMIISIILVQPGCQTTPDRADAADPQPAARVAETEPEGAVHPDFNAGLVAERRRPGDRQPPRRPDRPVESRDLEAGRTDVLEPLRPASPEPDDLDEPVSTYTVQRGDTLSGIARSRGVRLSDLLQLNDLTRESTIYVGQELRVPKAPEGEYERDQEGVGYEVRSGDTISHIARRHSVSVNAIREANNLRDDTIYVGQQLIIPGASAAAPPPDDVRRERERAPERVPDEGMIYEVRAGDTLGRIARRHGVSVSELRAANNIRGDMIRIGQKLRIPGVDTDPEEPAETVEEPPVMRQVPVERDEIPTLLDLERLSPLDDEEIPLVPVDDDDQ